VPVDKFLQSESVNLERQGAVWEMNLVRWLHISDLHFQEGDAYERDSVLRALIDACREDALFESQPDFVICSGDIAFSGRPEQYLLATAFFDELLVALKLGRERLFVVPGNHDIDRRAGSALVRTLKSEEESVRFFAEVPIAHVSSRQSAYAAWYNEFFNGIRTFSLGGSFNQPTSLNVGKSVVEIVEFNTAIFCLDDNDAGKLWLGRRCLSDVPNREKADELLRIAVMHHPISWLSEVEQVNIKSSLHDKFDIVARGHLHKNEIEQIADLSASTLFVAAGACYQTKRYPNTASICTWRDKTIELRPIRYFDEPREVWALDTSLFPREPTYTGSFRLGGGRQSVARQPASQVPSPTPLYQADLFLSPGGDVLYVDPRLATRPQQSAHVDEAETEEVSVGEIVRSSASYLIEARPEFGGSNLANRLLYEMNSVRAGSAIFGDARSLPNYARKLEREFPTDVTSGQVRATLILDNFDFERDDKLINELMATGWFNRFIVISMNRSSRLSVSEGIAHENYQFQVLYLWGARRSDVRSLAAALFSSNDQTFLSSVVDKTYRDLLGLCIPLTPANIIMYLRVLYKEGDFMPTNRVEIVGRYITEAVRRPSDALKNSFNAKNKLDVLGAFFHSLGASSMSAFSARTWLEFCTDYQKSTLTEFSSEEFLQELVEARVLSKYRDEYFCKYAFFHSYFVGRHIASRPQLIQEYVDSKGWLQDGHVIDVITGISSDNQYIVDHLTESLEFYLKDFEENYIRVSFDPLRNALWPDDDAEQEKLWGPIQKEIESGPRSMAQIDMLKTSLVAEARTADQVVSFRRFNELETALFRVGAVLTEALRNCDDVSGETKVRAYEAIISSQRVTFQLGSLFSSVLAQKKYFSWGGITFIDFNSAIRDAEPNSIEAQIAVIESLVFSLGRRIGDDLGSGKLGPLFKAREVREDEIDFAAFLNFCAVVTSKSLKWEKLAEKYIERTGRNSFYIWSMLALLRAELRYDIMSSADRDRMKRLVALIQAKRSFNKEAPKAKAVNSMLRHLEEVHHFDSKPPRPEVDGDDMQESDG